jgi:hypothetical protein
MLILNSFLFSYSISNTKAQTLDSNFKVFLPIIKNGNLHKPLLLGLYPKGWMGDQTVMDSQMNGLSDWAEVKLTFAGTFTDINEPNYDAAINQQLDKIYLNGYTPFINILPKMSAYSYAKGDADQFIRLWARAFKEVVSVGNRVAYIALMPEMNGNWVPYGYDPNNYKLSLIRTQRIFKEEGVPENTVRWVFAPNGWSNKDHNFEYYYPGDDIVDAIGFSAYNYGYCAYPGYTPSWNSLESITSEYIDRIVQMAPSKSIFIAQVASSAKTSTGASDSAKNNWFREGYNFLAQAENVRGIIYFNIDDNICDMAMWRTWPTTLTKNYPGYKEVIQSNSFLYMNPTEVFNNPILP